MSIRKIIQTIANEEKKAAKLTGIGSPTIAKNSFELREGRVGLRSLFGGEGRCYED
jgi:hypothetical protein